MICRAAAAPARDEPRIVWAANWTMLRISKFGPIFGNSGSRTIS
jgi:hypothetical protein